MILLDSVWENFRNHCFEDPERAYFAHGRLEIVGNHTDHNHGVCLVSGVDMGTTAAVRKRDDGVVNIVSKGYAPAEFSLSEGLAVTEQDGHSPLSLVKGVMAKMAELGYKVGGFDAYMESDIFHGAGVSSSACFESLVAEIVMDVYNDSPMDPLLMAKISQYSENVYFKKPSGLLDQIGACYGGLVYVDFLDPSEPEVEPLPWSFPLHPILLNTGGSHAGLTPLYAAIPSDMKSVAACFGKEFLRDLAPEEFFARVGELTGVSELAKLRATHYFEENKRVEQARVALKSNQLDSFLNALQESGRSSSSLLQNTMVPGRYYGSPQEAIDRLLPFVGKGAIRVMGGGFAGSVIAFLFPRDVKMFVEAAKGYYGAASLRDVNMEEGGPRRLR